MTTAIEGKLREIALAKERLALMEQKIELQEGLPFLYGWKWYRWAKDFFESTNKINLLCAANQISKSSTQIRKCIDWATNVNKWPLLWRHRPIQFWYLYPTGNQATIEFETKWKLFLPTGKWKDDPVYGWREEKKNKELWAIHFNSGVHVYFKSYAQDVQALQTGTCDALFCDEELPVDLYDELIFRVSASDGYFHMVFTATLGQEFWRLAMDPGPSEKENLPQAFKQTVSMFECMEYDDGTPGPWTEEKIQTVIARCKSEAEVQKRVYGKFIMDQGGRKYPQFNIKRNMKTAPGPVPKDWLIFGGADIGSGGTGGHPSAIVFVAVRPDFRFGRVFLGWRGDGVATTAGDVVEKFRQMRDQGGFRCAAQYYDWGCKDFHAIATRIGEPFTPADKSHEKGEEVINVLFKNEMLVVDEGLELAKLAMELSVLRKDQPKNKAKDDFCDALRYAVTRIPWDWSAIVGAKPEGWIAPTKQKTDMERQIEERRAQMESKSEYERIEDEFAEWNEHYGV